MLKTIVSTILGILSIVSFQFISASYHSRIEDNFLRYYLEIFKDFTFSDFRKSFTGIYKQNFTIPFWENLFGLILLFISILLNKKYLILFSSLLLMVLWIKNYIFFGGIMDSNLYFKIDIM